MRCMNRTTIMTNTAEVLPSPSNPSPRERRRFERLRVREIVPTYIGRAAGTLVDLSASGARVRHTSPLALGTRARLTFVWNGRQFAAIAEVLASRVVSLGSPTRFDSRLRFVFVPAQSERVLARALVDIGDRDLRTWVANLHGWEDHASRAEEPPPEAAFVRCRFGYGRWEQKWTQDPTQPEEGFTVPASVEPGEIDTLRRTYEQSDEEGRSMMRLLTRAVVQQHGGCGIP